MTTQGINYRPTLAMRWKIEGGMGKLLDAMGTISGARVLQQAWEGDDGTVEWRDVPVVVLPDK